MITSKANDPGSVHAPLVGRAGSQFVPEEQTNGPPIRSRESLSPIPVDTVAGSGGQRTGQSVAGNCPAFFHAWRMS